MIYPYYGKHPEGLLMYDRSGWMSVQIVSDPKPDIPKSNSALSFCASACKAPPRRRPAYFGTGTVDRRPHRNAASATVLYPENEARIRAATFTEGSA